MIRQMCESVYRFVKTGLLLVLLMSTPVVFGADQIDVFNFPDAATEQRYRLLIDEFRCPKCLNTNLSGSDAPIAKDLRRTVHRLVVVDGMTDQEVRDFLQARYGDFVLYDPPFKPGTWLLWLAPLLFGLAGLWVLVRVLRPSPPVVLSGQEQDRLKDILGQELTDK